MNRSKIEKQKPEQKLGKEPKSIVRTSSPNSTKRTVGCCTPMETLKNNILKSDILSDATKMIVGAFIDNQIGYEKQQIEFAFSEGFACSCFSVDKSAEQYFNNTFKK